MADGWWPLVRGFLGVVVVVGVGVFVTVQTCIFIARALGIIP